MKTKFKKLMIIPITLFTMLSSTLVLPQAVAAEDETTTSSTANTTTSTGTADTTDANATTTATADKIIDAKAAFAIDAKTGKVFFNENGDEALPIASMTKMLTLYLVEEAVADGKIKWEDTVEISDYLYALSADTELSNVPFSQTATYTVKELFDAAAIFSANAAAIALAEKIAGSEPKFVDMMRAKVESWGIKDAYLISSTGLNNDSMQGHIYPGSGANDENKMSARDVAIVAQHLITDYPEILDVTKETKKTFGADTDSPVEMTSWNWMLPGYNYFKEGVDGLKTGTTDLAGACFTGTIEKDGWRIITVVMHANQYKEDAGARFTETSKLMDYVYNNWEKKTVVKKGDVISGASTIPVAKGKALQANIAIAEDVEAWVSTSMDLSKIEMTFTPDSESLDADKALVAPVKKNTEVGTATINISGDTLGFVDASAKGLTAKVETTESVEKANIFVLVGRSIKNFFTSLF